MMTWHEIRDLSRAQYAERLADAENERLALRMIRAGVSIRQPALRTRLAQVLAELAHKLDASVVSAPSKAY
jgi:ribosomal protein L29